MQTYISLLLAGLLLLGLETIVPGGILGVIGGLALAGAIVVGFQEFPPTWAALNAIGIALLSCVTIIVWIKYFPRTIVGRILTLKADTKSYKASHSMAEFVGQTGVAQSTLRPAGIARIDNRRVDVVAEGNWIEKGSQIKVINVEGNRVVVRQIEA